MFKRLSSATRSTRKNNKAAVSQPPKAEEPINEPVSEQREHNEGRDGSSVERDSADALDVAFTNAETVVCNNDNVKEAMKYALAQGAEGDVIDRVFNGVENLACNDNTALLKEGLTKFAITKENKSEKVGISLRNSMSSNGIYVHSVAAGGKFEATGIQVGQKVYTINGQACPSSLDEAIGLLRDASGDLVLEVGANDEAIQQINEIADMNRDVALTTGATEIAVDGFNTNNCGFFWSIQNGICAFTPNNEIVASAEEEKEDSIVAEEKSEEPTEESAELSKEVSFKALADESETKSSGKKKSRFSMKKKSLKFPQKRSFSFKRSQSKSNKTEEVPSLEEPKDEVVEEEVVEEFTVEIPEAATAIKYEKEDVSEAVGLALRNSTFVEDGIYVYGIFTSSKLNDTELKQDMRVYTINGKAFRSVEEAVASIKDETVLEFVVGPNDEKPVEEANEEVQEEQKQEETKDDSNAAASSGWFFW